MYTSGDRKRASKRRDDGLWDSKAKGRKSKEERRGEKAVLLVCLEAADRPRMRCDLSKLSYCEIVDGVFCLWAETQLIR